MSFLAALLFSQIRSFSVTTSLYVTKSATIYISTQTLTTTLSSTLLTVCVFCLLNFSQLAAAAAAAAAAANFASLLLQTRFKSARFHIGYC
jgi:hypothetical protein